VTILHWQLGARLGRRVEVPASLWRAAGAGYKWFRVSPDDRVLPPPDRPRSRAVAAADIDGDGEP
jgi:hypothetical protein